MPPQFTSTDLKQAFQQARDFEGSMNERLALFVESVRRIRPGSEPVVDRLVARLREHKAGESAAGRNRPRGQPR